MRRIIAVVFLLWSALAVGQTMTHEEEVVRTTYARLAFANQVGEAHNMLNEGRQKRRKEIDRGDFRRRIQFGALQFELSKFKVGPLSEIAKVKYSDLVTKPSASGGDSLFVAPGHFNYQDLNSPIASARWAPSHDISEDWDQPFAALYAQTELAGQHSRYATFNVHVAFQGRTRDYRAMFLFGTDKTTGKEAVFAGDMVININGNALTNFVSEDVYPETLIEGGLGKDPAIHEWLNSGRVSGPGHNARKSNCDPSTLKCGIHGDDLKKLDRPTSLLKKTTRPAGLMDATLRGDDLKKLDQPTSQPMRPIRAPRLIDAAFHLPLPVHAMLQEGAPVTCSDFNRVQTLPPNIFADSGDHVFGEHDFAFFRQTSCLYSDAQNSNGKCNTTSTVDIVPATPQESGLTISGCHQDGIQVSAGFETATGDGAKSVGGAGGAVKSCLFCLCGVTIKIEKGPIGVTVTSDGFYTVKSDGVNSCVAQTQPVLTPPPPPPPCSPPPSDEQFTTSGGTDDQDCEPLIVDVEGKGFHLTDTAHGVVFDIRADGRPLRIPWTAGGPDNAFLVLDRNGNGVIDDGTELFSNVSPQSGTGRKNGFLALAEYDKPENGGNGDGVIDSHDAAYSSLRLWVDANHDGLSQPEELHKLHEMGVYSISLDYALSHRVDEFGNEFLFKAKVNQGIHGESEVGRKVYDVFFVTK